MINFRINPIGDLTYKDEQNPIPMKEINVKQINTQASLRKLCSSNFDSNAEIPIKGGWGYTIEDAIIIDKNDAAVPKDIPFDGIGLEDALVDKRVYLELNHLQDNSHKYMDIHWEVEKQELVANESRYFDKIAVRITALHLDDYKSRRKEWKENGRKPDFDKEWFMKKSLELIQYCNREFWFDITSFYAQ